MKLTVSEFRVMSEEELFRRYRNYVTRDRAGLRKYYEYAPSWSNLLDQAEQFFVGKQALKAILGDQVMASTPVPAGTPIDFPFSICLLESDYPLLLVNADEPGWKEECFSLLCVEDDNGRYRIWGLIHAPEITGSSITFEPQLYEFSSHPLAEHVVREVFSHKTPATFGVERTSISFPRKSSTPRDRREVKRITHIVYGNRASPVKYEGRAGGRVEWDHSWTVRGHWRRVAGVGKDRKGNPGVLGHTWVVPHVKGVAGVDPVAKLRIVRVAGGNDAA